MNNEHPENPPRRGRAALEWVKGRRILEVVGKAVTLVSLVMTLKVVSPKLAMYLGDSTLDHVAGWGAAIVADLVWLGAMTALPAALQERRTKVAVITGVLTLVGAAGSAVAIGVYGGAHILAAVPVAAMLILALDMLIVMTLSDRETRRDIAHREAGDRATIALREADSRSRLALVHSQVAAIRSEGEAEALEETAITAALAHKAAAQANALAAAEGEVMAARSAAQGVLLDAEKKHAEGAAAFMNRGLDMPTWGPVTPLRSPALQALMPAALALPPRSAALGTTAGAADGNPQGEAFGSDLDERTEADGVETSEAGPVETPEPDTPPAPPEPEPDTPAKGAADGGDGGAADGPEANSQERPKPPLRKPAVDDDELYGAGFDVYRRLGPPRTQNKFLAAMRDAGHSASDGRLRDLFKRIEHDVSDLAVDAIAGAED
ncbi:hypothetical protein [Streptomyces sp. NPDC101115]|uniref:hypothetical protein n=1 Tax=Streptomyces sp. NPDC101115 TaxID=3366106 RepID=UPI0038138AC3